MDAYIYPYSSLKTRVNLWHNKIHIHNNVMWFDNIPQYFPHSVWMWEISMNVLWNIVFHKTWLRIWIILWGCWATNNDLYARVTCPQVFTTLVLIFRSKSHHGRWYAKVLLESHDVLDNGYWVDLAKIICIGKRSCTSLKWFLNIVCCWTQNNTWTRWLCWMRHGSPWETSSRWHNLFPMKVLGAWIFKPTWDIIHVLD